MPESKQISSENNFNSNNIGIQNTSNSDSSSISSSSSSSTSSFSLPNTKGNSGMVNTAASTTSTSSVITSSASQATEKPSHYTYLKGFRVEQCSLFLQHKCTQHRPYTCFYWHFKNQRRRRPIRKRDGTFNYNPDVYCDKYDEQTGICPNSDDCPYVHRNAGDTEKRYHLRYYKTATCIHETDAKGNCSKNGPHCAFAHGASDMRPPVYDLRELQLQQQQQQLTKDSSFTSTNKESNSFNNQINDTSENLVNEKAINLSTTLEKERILNEDPKWNDTNYVLINYKTEQCKRPPRLCRQGFACPQFHNARDKRRNPNLFKYRSTPCPNVKQGDDWLEPTVCENGDSCKYCHSRTEQQFHPEIYKSSKCNDMISTGYCPRGPFCAFAHIEQELKNQRTHSTSESSSSDYTLENFISNVLPNTRENDIESNLENNELNDSPNHLNLKHKPNEESILNDYDNQDSITSQINSVVKKDVLRNNNSNNLTLASSVLVGSSLNNNLLNTNFSLSSAYNKPIGSEREKPKTIPQFQQHQKIGISSQLLINNTNNSKSLSLTNRSSSPYQPLNDNDQLSNQVVGSPNIQNQQIINFNTPKTNDSQNILGLNSNNNQSDSSSSSSPSPISSATSVNNITNSTKFKSTSMPNQNSLSSPNNLVNLSNSSLEQNNLSSNTIIPLQLLNSAFLDNTILNNTQDKFIPINTTNQSASLSLGLTISQQQLAKNQQQNIVCNLKSENLNTNIGLNTTPQQTASLIDLEKEKLKQDLIKQTEMSNKLETLCLQYRQWVEKLTMDLNDLKAKYIRSESEKKNLELQLFNKLSIEQTIATNRNFNLNCNNNINNNSNLSNSNSNNNINTLNSNLTNLTNITNNNTNLNNLSNKNK